jgi:hypothetical protein
MTHAELVGLNQKIKITRLASMDSPVSFILLEKLDTGEWRLMFDRNTIDIKKLQAITFSQGEE